MDLGKILALGRAENNAAQANAEANRQSQNKLFGGGGDATKDRGDKAEESKE